MAFAQSKVSYKGKIVDASGEPIIGATIKEKGTNNGVATDLMVMCLLRWICSRD